MEVGPQFIIQNVHPHLSDTETLREETQPILLDEEVSLRVVLLPEHHFDPQYANMPGNMQWRAYVAARTHRIDLGTGASSLPWHENPTRVAERIVRDYLARYYQTLVRREDFDGSHRGETQGYQAGASMFREVGLEAVCKAFLHRQVWGTPEQIVAKWIERVRSTGQMRPSFAASSVGLPFDLVGNRVRLHGGKVVPARCRLWV